MLLTLYTRQGCHLCEDMLEQLRELQSELVFQLDVREVDSNPHWRLAYNDLVPLLYAGDREVCRYFLDLAGLKEALEQCSEDNP